MKFKVPQGSPLYAQLIQLKEKVNHVQEQARLLSLELGADGFYPRQFCLAGGISALSFKEKPKGYKKVWDEGYYPALRSKAGQALAERLEALPTVSYEELNTIVGFEKQYLPAPTGHGRRVLFCPGLYWAKDCVLLTMDDACRFTPPAGMQEITTTEFHQIKKEA